ncbi:MAG: hypothetical protein SGILL_009894 [Bacillariaceae sp.]
MSTPTIQRAVQLNDEASRHLVNGDADLALDRYKKALSILRDGLQEDEESSMVWEEHGHNPGVQIANDTPIQLRAYPSIRGNRQSFVSARPLHYQEVGAHGVERNTCMKLLSAVVIFNLSLLYHTIDLDRGTTALQPSCIQLYDMCRELLDRAEVRHHRESAILRAICLNNMAVITYDLDEYATTEALLQNLVHCLTTQDGPNEYFGPHEMQGFALNCMLLRAPTGAKAA